MQASNRFKSALLKQMVLGFQLSAFSCRTMSFQEKRCAIKLSADAAMAAARGSTRWTHGLVANLSKKEDNKFFLKCILGKEYERLTTPCCTSSWKIQRCKKILRRSCRARASCDIKSSVLARNMAKKRTRVLKRLVPGGEALGGFSLLDETLDYVVCLRAQVDLMRHLLKVFQASNLKAQTKNRLQERKASLFVGK